MERTLEEIYRELVKEPFLEAQIKCPYITYGEYQRMRLLYGIDKIIIDDPQ